MPHRAKAMPEFSPRTGPVALSFTRRAVVGVLLAVSFICNIEMLSLPFMELRKGLSTSPYSLLNSVRLLWTSGLVVLAVLVVAFSLVFPFLKLGVLAWLCAAGRIGARSRWWLGLADRLGKWSMLDVFLVCIILTLASGQLLVGAKPQAGIPLFVGAIMLSMLSGEILSAGLPHADTVRPSSPGAFRQSGWLIVLYAAVLIGAVRSPFLRIHDWFVADRAYSITSVVPTLAQSGSTLAAAIVGGFLIVLPLATWAATCAWWWPWRKGKPSQLMYRLMKIGQRWSMLDVFGLALAVFAFEGKYLMRTEVRAGALYLAVLAGLQLGIQAALSRAFSRD